MKIYYYHSFIIKIYDLGLSFLPLYKAKKETLDTLTALKWTPGMSPTAWPLEPNPATRTSSFSSIKFKQSSLGTKGCDFLPLLVNWTLTHFLMAEFGCLASTPIFSSTILLAWEVHLKGLAFRAVPKWALLYCYHAISGLVGSYRASWLRPRRFHPTSTMSLKERPSCLILTQARRVLGC